MFVNGACPLSTVLQSKAAVWRRIPMKANLNPIFDRPSFFEERKER